MKTDSRICRRRFLRAGVAVAACGTWNRQALAQTPIAQQSAGPAIVLSGVGANVVSLPGSNGALVIDGGLAAHAEPLHEAITAMPGPDRIQRLINTHWHPEVTGLNATVGAAGGEILAHEKTAMYLANPVFSVLYEGRLAALPEVALPGVTVRTDGSFEHDGTEIQYGYLPAAHTDGDLYVYVPEADLLVTGGVVAAQRWPLLDYRNGAWYGGRVRALQWLTELTGPQTTVVPVDGPLMTGADIAMLSDIYQQLFETLIEYMNRGYGPEDAAAAKPLSAWHERFGDADEFVYGAYRSMLIAYVPD